MAGSSPDVLCLIGEYVATQRGAVLKEPLMHGPSPAAP